MKECLSHFLDPDCDISIRKRWFVEDSFSHPAKLHLGLLAWLVDKYTLPGQTIADPMAGSGGILYAASLQRHIIAREIEPCWIELMQENAAHITAQAGLFAGRIDIGQADAREVWGYSADHILFSPPYGNEVSTTPNGRRMLHYRLHKLTVPYDRLWQHLAERPSPGAMGAVTFHYGTHPAQVGHLRGERYWTAMSSSTRRHTRRYTHRGT
jgi:23S rRNA G2445 N2-methylase RlmL